MINIFEFFKEINQNKIRELNINLFYIYDFANKDIS